MCCAAAPLPNVCLGRLHAASVIPLPDPPAPARRARFFAANTCLDSTPHDRAHGHAPIDCRMRSAMRPAGSRGCPMVRSAAWPSGDVVGRRRIRGCRRTFAGFRSRSGNARSDQKFDDVRLCSFLPSLVRPGLVWSARPSGCIMPGTYGEPANPHADKASSLGQRSTRSILRCLFGAPPRSEAAHPRSWRLKCDFPCNSRPAFARSGTQTAVR